MVIVTNSDTWTHLALVSIHFHTCNWQNIRTTHIAYAPHCTSRPIYKASQPRLLPDITVIIYVSIAQDKPCSCNDQQPRIFCTPCNPRTLRLFLIWQQNCIYSYMIAHLHLHSGRIRSSLCVGIHRASPQLPVRITLLYVV